MSTEALLALGALIVAIVAIPIAVWATRRYGNRRRKLLFLFEATPLVPAPTVGSTSDLKVTFRDVAVDDPHLVTLHLENVGPADVASGLFDSGRPISIKLNSTLYGLVSSSHPVHTIIPAAGTGNAVIEIAPFLLKRQEAWAVEAVVSGQPNPIVDSSLIDTDIVSRTTANRIGLLALAAVTDVLTRSTPSVVPMLAKSLINAIGRK